MGSTWDHPRLGRFKYDEDEGSWMGTVNVPAFKAFSDDGISNPHYQGPRPRLTGKYVLAIDADDEADLPSPTAIALASKVLANQAKLVATVVRALWDDFNGRGPNSGMWWHGDLKSVAFNMLVEKPLAKPDDLLKVLQVSGITVRKSVYRHDKPIVELSFHAAFEEEHGVGVLTDGRTVLGIGYSVDVTPFEPE